MKHKSLKFIADENRLLRFISYFFFVLSFIVLVKYTQDFLKITTDTENIWIYGAWLTNYAGGFTRRGLMGEFFNLFNPQDVKGAVFTIQCALYLFFFSIVYLGAVFFTKRPITNLFFLVFPPFGLFYYVAQPWALGRGEIVFLISFFIFVYLYKITGKAVCYYLLALLLFASSFIHENYIFFLGPFMAVSLILHSRGMIRLVHLSVPILVSVIMTIIMTFMSASGVAEPICSSLGVNEFRDCKVAGPIFYLDTNLHYSVMNVVYHISTLEAAQTFYIGAFLVFASILLYGWIHCGIRLRLSQLLLIFLSMLGCIPLFILANDWGRWQHGLYLVTIGSLFLLEEKSDGKIELATHSRKLNPPLLALISFWFVSSLVSVPVSGKHIAPGYGVILKLDTLTNLQKMAEKVTYRPPKGN